MLRRATCVSWVLSFRFRAGEWHFWWRGVTLSSDQEIGLTLCFRLTNYAGKLHITSKVEIHEKRNRREKRNRSLR